MATSRGVALIWDPFGFSEGSRLAGPAAGEGGVEARTECQAGQTLTLNPPLQSGAFVDALPCGER